MVGPQYLLSKSINSVNIDWEQSHCPHGADSLERETDGAQSFVSAIKLIKQGKWIVSEWVNVKPTEKELRKLSYELYIYYHM